MGLGARTLAADRQFRGQWAIGEAGPRVGWVPPVDEALPEVARIFELDRRLARRVAAVRGRGALPVVLGGNCVSCLGTTAGVQSARKLGVVWLDAHADFDTPEDNLSGFTDVMGLSVLTGGCWRALRETIPGFATVDEGDVVLAGVRDLEDYQWDRVCGSRLRVVTGAIEREDLRAGLDELRNSVNRVYLHIDLDVLDASVGRANPYAAPGGPDLDAVLAAIADTFARFEVEAVALTAYDPTCDPARAIVSAARSIAGQIAAHPVA
jgi:arginase